MRDHRKAQEEIVDEYFSIQTSDNSTVGRFYYLVHKFNPPYNTIVCVYQLSLLTHRILLATTTVYHVCVYDNMTGLHMLQEKVHLHLSIKMSATFTTLFR